MVNFTTKLPNFYNRNATGVGGNNIAAGGASGTGGTGGSNSFNTTGISAATRSNGVNFNNNADVNTFGRYAPNIGIGATISANPSGSLAVGVSVGSVGVTYASTGYSNPNVLNPVSNRLSISGLPLAGVFSSGIFANSLPQDTLDVYAGFTDSTEDRVIISDQTGKFIGSASNFAPLVKTGGVLFPYNPVISISHKANYELDRLIHTNYSTPYYTSSSVDSIQLQGRFTANTPDEAVYVLAMMHFFKTATKMFYGASTNKGTPPPILYLDGYGQALLDHVPVVISDFTYNLPNDVHYITAKYLGRNNKVPVDLNVTVSCIPTYSRNKISNNFSLNNFANGGLLTSGNGQRSGGWI